ncbi:MAG: Ig-like domain-containing protein [Burkholderiales bacterium]|nr:Ig-like domain-containing protein [Burkholderiales bacterium]
MASKFRRSIVLSAGAAVTLAACGGGGSTDPAPVVPATNPVSSLTANSTSLFAFPGDTKQLSVVAKDAAGATVASPSVTWSSTNTAVATVDSAGKVTVVAAGAGVATIVAASGSVTTTVPLTVNATPASVADLAKAFPYKKAGAGVGTGAAAYAWSASSDVSVADAEAQEKRARLIATRLSTYYPEASVPMDWYFTSDKTLLTKHAARVAGLSAEEVAKVDNLVQAADADGRVASFYYLRDGENPIATMSHEFAEFSLDACVKTAGTPDAYALGFLREGGGLYWESGTVNETTGAFTFTKPRSDLITSFKAFAVSTPSTLDIATLKTKDYNQIVASTGTNPTDRTALYPASAMLFSFLQITYPTQLATLISEVSAGTGTSFTGGGVTYTLNAAGAVARLVVLLSTATPAISTEAALTTAYSNWALALTA